MKLIVLVLLQVLLHKAHSQYCPAQLSLNYSETSCVFQYEYSDANCTQFKFKECLWIECVDWVTEGNNTYCGRTELFYDYNWNYCTYQCCDSSASYPYEYSSINQCQDYLNQMHRLFLIIMGSILGVILLIALVRYLSKWGNEQDRKIECKGFWQDCLINCLCSLCCLFLKGKRRRRGHEHHRDFHTNPSQEMDKDNYAGQSSDLTNK